MRERGQEILKGPHSCNKKDTRCPVWISELRLDSHLGQPGNSRPLCNAMQVVPVFSTQTHCVSHSTDTEPYRAWGLVREEGEGKWQKKRWIWVLLLPGLHSAMTHIFPPLTSSTHLYLSQISNLNFDLMNGTSGMWGQGTSGLRKVPTNIQVFCSPLWLYLLILAYWIFL